MGASLTQDVTSQAKELAAQVDGTRLWSRLMKLADFGKMGQTGVHRLTLTPIEAEARAHLVALAKSLGLQAFSDPAGNLFLRLEGQQPDLPAVVSGSHIDSQPNGGMFDGAYGVMAALEAVETMVQAGARPLRSIEVVAWTNEEAARFAPGMTGSEAFTGLKDIADLRKLQDQAGVSLGQALDDYMALDKDVSLRGFKRPVAGYIEAHIEQDRLLEAAQIPLGIVTGMQGTRRYRVTVKGEAAHAGTALRHEKRDALMAAMRIICALDEASAAHPLVKLTFGRLDLTPNAPSVVPEQAYFSIDLRHPDNAIIDEMDATIRSVLAHADQTGPCSISFTQIAHAPSFDFPHEIRALLLDTAAEIGQTTLELYSAAGHDARSLHGYCPSGMIFIPCRNGLSHNPDEWAEPADVTAGARLLTAALWRMSNAI